VCSGDKDVDPAKSAGAPALRFGVTPSGAAGQLGPVPSPFAADRPDAIAGALRELRRPGAPFVTHVYHSWKDAGDEEDARLRDLAAAYAAQGHEVEFVVRYRPTEEQEGDVEGFARHVRHLVRLLGPNRAVIAFQVTNEVNFPVSPDSSDGAFERAREALIEGVVAGHDEARRGGFGQLEMGFNWLYRFDPREDASFWQELGARGGDRFRAALGWIGLDVYPGTFYPPSVPPGMERDFVIDALSVLRECYAPMAGVSERVPIHIQENGFPTGPGRTYERQEQALENMVRAVHDARGVFNVSDYRWFNLRDAQTASPNFQQQYGLMTDQYEPKPAFKRYAALVRELGATGTAPPTPGAPPRATGCTDTTPPRSRIRVRRDGRLAASTRDVGCAGVRQVLFAVARKAGRRCRHLGSDGRFGPRTSCHRTRYHAAAPDTDAFRGGSYLVWSRAIDRAGNVERKARRRNLRRIVLGDTHVSLGGERPRR
jgi:hypothetical protein